MLKGKSQIEIIISQIIQITILYKIIFSQWLWEEWSNNTKEISITKKIKKLYCVNCCKYREFEQPKISYLLENTLVLSTICSKCKNEDENYLKKKN